MTHSEGFLKPHFLAQTSNRYLETPFIAPSLEINPEPNFYYLLIFVELNFSLTKILKFRENSPEIDLTKPDVTKIP